MTGAVSIIKALAGNSETGMCRCPCHDDKKASLHISEKNGKVLWKCHAGCSQERVRQALIEKGLWSEKRNMQTTARESQRSDEHDTARARNEANRRWKEAKPAWEQHPYWREANRPEDGTSG
jgi:putative DNA primase/helicase